MYSKQSQLQKNKQPNQNKMSEKEYKAKCDWLFNRYPKCQICLINNSEDAHHIKNADPRQARLDINMAIAVYGDIDDLEL